MNTEEVCWPRKSQPQEERTAADGLFSDGQPATIIHITEKRTDSRVLESEAEVASYMST